MKISSGMEKKLEKILQILDNLAAESARGIPVIVEGRKDVEALDELQIKDNIIEVKTGGKNLLDLLNEVERLDKDEVILLMDFDRRGRELVKYLTRRLEKMKIKPNTVFWRELSGLLRRDVKDVEGMPSYIETLKRKAGRVQNEI